MKLGVLVRRVNYALTARISHRGLHELIELELARATAVHARPRVLAVGAGGALGSRIERWRDRLKLVTVDIDPARGPDVVADACDLAPFADASFDLVFAMEVLEHVAEPARATAAMHRVLVAGGRFVASTPFFVEQHDVPHDFYRFTRFGLQHLLSHFSSHEIVARSGYFTSALMPLMRLSHRPSTRDAFVGTAAVLVAYTCCPAVIALDRLIESKDATIGFSFTAVK